MSVKVVVIVSVLSLVRCGSGLLIGFSVLLIWLFLGLVVVVWWCWVLVSSIIGISVSGNVR